MEEEMEEGSEDEEDAGDNDEEDEGKEEGIFVLDISSVNESRRCSVVFTCSRCCW